MKVKELGEGVGFWIFFFFGRATPAFLGGGVELELQLPAYVTAIASPDLSHIRDLHHSSQQRWILNPLSKARD